MDTRFKECVEALQEFETKLQNSIAAVGAPPFIGLLDVGEGDRDRIRSLVSRALSGSDVLLRVLFSRTPLSAAWSVASALAENYGEADAAVYRVIENALGISLPATGSSRHVLHDRFAKEIGRAHV